jgi:hypothetical protein
MLGWEPKLTDDSTAVASLSIETAIAYFLLNGYPIPYRAFSRASGIHHAKIKRIEERVRRQVEEYFFHRDAREKEIIERAPMCLSITEGESPPRALKVVAGRALPPNSQLPNNTVCKLSTE